MDLGSFFSGMGQAAGGGLIGAGMNAINQAINYKYATKMADYNYNLNEKAAESADARRRALYQDYESPLATIRQLKEAGLSPSLYAGGELGGGIGATSGAQGAGASGASIPGNAANSVDLASINLMNAQAEKAKAEAETLSGKNKRGQYEIAKIWSETGALKAAKELKEAETTNTNLNNYVLSNTKEFKISEAKALAAKQEHEAESAFYKAKEEGLQWQFDKETYNERVDMVSKEKSLLIARTLAAESKAKLSDAQVEKIGADIEYLISKNLREWSELENETKNVDAYVSWVEAKVPYISKEIENRTKELKIEAWKVGASYFNSIIHGACMITGAGMLGKGSTTNLGKNMPTRDAHSADWLL